MAFNIFYTISIPLSLLLVFFFSPSSATVNASDFKTYIVHTNSIARPSNFSNQNDWYSFMLKSFRDPKSSLIAKNCILYVYDVVLDGFSAKLTAEEARKMTEASGVIGVYEDQQTNELHTTHTPDFLGLNVNYGLWNDTNFGDDVIIGLVDSGIWPESKSFNDDGLAPIGSKWRGECEEGIEFNSSYCNNKIIGARFFAKGIEASLGPVEGLGDYKSPRDGSGHGTHTASTAAGAEVEDANMFGFARGYARGIATKARIAMYKACWKRSCFSSDILAAMEKAIEDGVHVLSLSLGASFEIPYYENPIHIGAFAALRRRIFVTCSAGNRGPSPFSVVNSAPWITTVGAGSIDRTFPAQVMLGNGEVLMGSSLYSSTVDGSSSFPLVYMGFCFSENLVPENVMGKIIACDGGYGNSINNSFLVAEAGGVGFIELGSQLYGEGLIAKPFIIPGLAVGYRATEKILSYINSNRNPTANLKIDDLTIVGKNRAPMVAFYSSRGPNSIVPQILKPDILAPGSNILAAWPDNKSPSPWSDDPRRVTFNIISGTSMACPHIAGIAALLIKAHPNWSPAAIRSAMMTTADPFDRNFRPIAGEVDLGPDNFLGFGSGHIHPQMAADPGLIYDADVGDYISFLCALNYTQEQLSIVVNGFISCTTGIENAPGDLNYPSFSILFEDKYKVQVLKRTLTNVAELPENYTVRVVNPRPDKVEISVKPERLMFKMYEKHSYTVEFKSNFTSNSSNPVDEMEYGSVIWESDLHIVRSPVALMWN